jgi:hypothetical protein
MAACRSNDLYKASTAVALINQLNAVYCTLPRQLTPQFIETKTTAIVQASSFGFRISRSTAEPLAL